MNCITKINPTCLTWLLEVENPGVRYLALRDLMNLSQDDHKLTAAREKAHQVGPITTILNAMNLMVIGKNRVQAIYQNTAVQSGPSIC